MEDDIKKLIEYVEVNELDPFACHSYGEVIRCKCCKSGINVQPRKHKKDCWLINFLAKYDDDYKNDVKGANKND